jgi:hypothetical protein
VGLEPGVEEPGCSDRKSLNGGREEITLQIKDKTQDKR